MKKIFLLSALFASLTSFGQVVGTTKTEQYKASFETKINIDSLKIGRAHV